MKIQLTLIAVVIMVSGCTSLNQLARDEAKIPITYHNDEKKVKESGAVFLWPPYSSAAVVDGKGNRCVLAASGAKSVEASAEMAFKLGKALEKIEGLDMTTKSNLAETFTKLSASGAQSTFADVALFHLCILDQNGTFSHTNESGNLVKKSRAVMDAYLQTIEVAKSIQ